MFSADLTWAPLAEEATSRQSAHKKDRENASIRSRDTSMTEKGTESRIGRLRWPLSKPSTPRFDTDSVREGAVWKYLDTPQGQSSYVGAEHYGVTTQVVSTKAASEAPQDWRTSPTSEIFRRVEVEQVEQTVGSEPHAHDLPRNEVFELSAPLQSNSNRRSLVLRSPSYMSDVISSEKPTHGEHTQMGILSPAPSSTVSSSGRRRHSLARASSMSSTAESDATGLSSREASGYIHAARVRERVLEEEPDKRVMPYGPTSVRNGGHFTEVTHTYLQSFIRRMARASPSLLHGRLTEEWDALLDEEGRADVRLEKQLCTISALHQLLARPQTDLQVSIPSPQQQLPRVLSGGNRVLELGSSAASIHHLAALHPNASITWVKLGPSGRPDLPVPPNVHVLAPSTTLPTTFPFLDCSFDHIRAHFSPSLYPAPKLKSLLEECHRLLGRGGVLEMLLLNPIPDANAGPTLRDWVETHLIIELEKDFIGSRPAVLVPVWCREVGLSLDGANSVAVSASRGALKQIKFPVAVAEADVSRASGDDVLLQEAIDCEVGRNIYREMWGRYVSGPLFWEDPETLKECREKGVFMNCTLLCAVKGDL